MARQPMNPSRRGGARFSLPSASALRQATTPDYPAFARRPGTAALTLGAEDIPINRYPGDIPSRTESALQEMIYLLERQNNLLAEILGALTGVQADASDT